MKNQNNGFSLKSAAENKVISRSLQEAKESMGYVASVDLLSPADVDNWEYRDRKEFELGDIEALADSIKNNGQAQPIVVTETSTLFRPQKNSEAKYVVIAGYRRWLACKKIGIKIEAIIKTFSFEGAIGCVINENKKEDVSEYSKGIFYANLLQSGKISQASLSQKIGITLSSLKNYLAFSRMSKELILAIGDMRNVSARSAIEITSLFNKGAKYQQALLDISDKIRQGYGEKRIKREVLKKMDVSTKNQITSMSIFSGNKKLAQLSNETIKLDKSLKKEKNYQEFLKDFESLLKTHFGVDVGQ